MSTTSLVWLVVVVILVALGGWYFLSMNPSYLAPAGQTQTNQNPNGPDYSPNGTPGSNTSSSSTTVNINVSTGNPPTSATIAYNGDVFSPQSVTIKKGGTVTWVSQGGASMWVASAPHPTHQGYDGTTESQHCAAGYSGAKPFDECGIGSSFSFTFNKVGTWNFHNHQNSSDFGSVTVVE